MSIFKKSALGLFKSKKAVESYVIGIASASAVATVLLIFALGNIYVSDDPLCEAVEFKVSNQCFEGSKYTFIVQNNNENLPLDFLIDGKRDISRYSLDGGETKEISFSSGDSDLEIVPLYISRVNTYECRAKKVVLEKKRLLRC